MVRVWLVCGALLGALGIGIGAFGAHWLQGAVKEWTSDPVEQARKLAVWEVAVRYQIYQGLALLALGTLMLHRASAWYNAAASCMLVGTIVFSGCLYLLVLTGARWLGAVVPLGGVLMILGWLLLAIGCWRTLGR